MIDTLPDKLHELLALALHDFREIETDPQYCVDMCHYHKYAQRKCAVCLAGSILAKTLNTPPMVTVHLLDDFGYNSTIYKKMCAINCMRMGEIRNAAYELCIDGSELPFTLEVCPYEDDREQFFSDMDKVLQYLKEVNR